MSEHEQYERGAKARIPRWALVALILLAVLGLLFVVMLLLGGPGGHGPGRHTGLAAAAGAEPGR
jgi:hypothetical protein